VNPTRVLLSLLAERLGQTAGRWPRQLFGGAEAPTLREAIAARVEPRLMAPDAGQFGDRPLRVFHGTPEEFSPEGIRALTQSPDGGSAGAGQNAYREQLRADGFDVETRLYHGRSSDLAEHFDISRQAVSKHLRILTECDLVKQESRGREIYYQLEVKKIKEVDQWLEQFRKLWEKRFEQLDELLLTLNKKKK
jgi:DNA-binding transcriptional ArsR family regulator